MADGCCDRLRAGDLPVVPPVLHALPALSIDAPAGRVDVQRAADLHGLASDHCGRTVGRVATDSRGRIRRGGGRNHCSCDGYARESELVRQGSCGVTKQLNAWSRSCRAALSTDLAKGPAGVWIMRQPATRTRSSKRLWVAAFSLATAFAVAQEPSATAPAAAPPTFNNPSSVPLQQYRAMRRMHASTERFSHEGWMDALTEFDAGGFRYQIVAERGSDT